MISRCTHEYATRYPDYGAKGITICEEWMDFRKFLADMGERPPGTTIDRIDGSLGYFAQNCRWASPKEQSRNTRTARLFAHEGEMLSMSELAIRLGVAKSTLRYRLLHESPPTV